MACVHNYYNILIMKALFSVVYIIVLPVPMIELAGKAQYLHMSRHTSIIIKER